MLRGLGSDEGDSSNTASKRHLNSVTAWSYSLDLADIRSGSRKTEQLRDINLAAVRLRVIYAFHAELSHDKPAAVEPLGLYSHPT